MIVDFANVEEGEEGGGEGRAAAGCAVSGGGELLSAVRWLDREEERGSMSGSTASEHRL